MKKFTYSSVLMIVFFLLNACEKKVVEDDFLSDLKLDFSGLEIDFELLFEYESKDDMLLKADSMFKDLLEEARIMINEKEGNSHLLVSLQITQSKAKLKEMLIYDLQQRTVNDYHNYTIRLGALDGLSANEELLHMAFDSVAPENFAEVELVQAASANMADKATAFTQYLNNHYDTPSDTLNIILVVGKKDVRAYSSLY